MKPDAVCPTCGTEIFYQSGGETHLPLHCPECAKGPHHPQVLRLARWFVGDEIKGIVARVSVVEHGTTLGYPRAKVQPDRTALADFPLTDDALAAATAIVELALDHVETTLRSCEFVVECDSHGFGQKTFRVARQE